jgi:DNA-binding LacI/PurR family transcriptional regulator
VDYVNGLRVPLSTVDQSSTLMGEKAAALMVRLIDAKAALVPVRILIPPRLVMRESRRCKVGVSGF